MLRSAVVFLATWSAVRAAAGEPAVRIVPDGDDPTRIVVSCAAPRDPPTATIDEAAGRRHLTLAVVGETGPTDVPILGTYAVVEGRLTFRPRFGLVRGATYRATTADGAAVEYRVPASESAEPAIVASITPGGERLPANLLRFYVTFSRPMREGREVLERIRLVDDEGKEIGAPWRDLELWNADATRLSLFLHPGRIKQGVNLRVELGPILEPGRRYTLVIGGDLLDARGLPLGREVRKKFTTTEELRERIDVARWRMSQPHAGSRTPLTIDFGRTLDDALARRCLTVHDAAGAKASGRVELTDEGRRWSFTPTTDWQAERYVLDVDPVLEDVCGNSPLRAFDVDLEAPQVDVLPPVLRREFTPP